MPKCLKCGAGPEWLQGKILSEPSEEPVYLVGQEISPGLVVCSEVDALSLSNMKVEIDRLNGIIRDRELQLSEWSKTLNWIRNTHRCNGQVAAGSPPKDCSICNTIDTVLGVTVKRKSETEVTYCHLCMAYSDTETHRKCIMARPGF